MRVQPAHTEYAELKRLVKEQGLMNKQPFYYTHKIVLVLVMLAASVAVVVLVENFWIQLLNAASMGFVFTQLGFLGHDGGHRQIFVSSRRNDAVGLAVNFLIGTSRSWWVNQHNEHHSNPNDLDLDPHIALPVIAFSQEQAKAKTGFLRFIIRYQAFYFTPMLLAQGIGMRAAAVQYMITQRVKYPILEPTLMALHFVLYFALLFIFLDAWHALAFFVAHQAFFGLYMGSIFAPNHKGMMTTTRETKIDFLRRQVLTSRNIKPHPFSDFWYGGLNYQIEHHLFPTIPRNRLKQTRQIVKRFCDEHSIAYYETGAFKSQWEILSALHEFSAPLRERAKQ